MTHTTRSWLVRTATASCVAAGVTAGAVLALQPGSSAAEVRTTAAVERSAPASAGDDADCEGGPWGPGRLGDLPRELREDLRAAWELDTRAEVRAELERIFDAALAGEYGERAQELAEQRDGAGPWGGPGWGGGHGPWGGHGPGGHGPGGGRGPWGGWGR